MTQLLVILAIVSTIAAYWVYRKQILQDSVAPNRWSWLIWGLTMIVEAMTFQAVGQNLTQSIVVFVSAFACMAVALSVWRHQEWRRPTWTEYSSVGLAISAMIVWLVFQQSWWAHILVIIAVPISFLPTWAGLRDGRGDEAVLPWILWTIGDALTLVVIFITLDDLREIPYMAVETLCHASVCAISLWQHYWRQEK